MQHNKPIHRKIRRCASPEVVAGRLHATWEAFCSSGLPRALGWDCSSPCVTHDEDYSARIAKLLHPSEALPSVLDRYEKLRAHFSLYGLKVSTDFQSGDDGLLRVDEVSLGHEIPLVKNLHSD